MKTRYVECAITFALLSTACGGAEQQDAMDGMETIVVENVGFATPESVYHDTAADVYLVSNINGSPLEVDDNGFISRVAPSGEVVELKWIDGASEAVTLNAPKGMTMSGNILYVADLTVVRMFDRETGAPMGEIAVEGSSFLNDLATGPNGTVYLTDTGFQGGEQGFVPSGTDAVYRIENGEAVAIAEGDALGRPNGVVVAGEAVWVVTFGSGALYQVQEMAPVNQMSLPEGSLDGVVMLDDGDLLISSWDAQAVYRGPVGGPFEVVVRDVPAPADIGYDAQRGRVLIPLFQDNAVRIVPL
jgi:hypothetical protein